MIGRIASKASNGYEYILVGINYFTKWVEAASYSVLKAKHVARLLENNIICRFRVPQEIHLITVPILRGRFEGSWSCTTSSITSLHRFDHKLMVS